MSVVLKVDDDAIQRQTSTMTVAVDRLDASTHLLLKVYTAAAIHTEPLTRRYNNPRPFSPPSCGQLLPSNAMLARCMSYSRVSVYPKSVFY